MWMLQDVLNSDKKVLVLTWMLQDVLISDKKLLVLMWMLQDVLNSDKKVSVDGEWLCLKELQELGELILRSRRLFNCQFIIVISVD